MFSGIIEKKAKILSINEGRFQVQNIFWNDLNIGQSIAHDGACMSIEKFDDESYTFYMMQESLSKTNFWNKNIWDEFNIERCVRAWDRLDGHIVTGHIDTTWKVSRFEQLEDESWVLWVEFDTDFSQYTVHKWSIALNWTSLTISKDDVWYIEVSLIPITLSETNLGNTQLWDIINIEFDILGKYIVKNNNLK